MKNLMTVAVALLVVGVLPLPAFAETISKADYAAGKTRIGAAYKADVSACESRAGNAKDVCLREAKGRQRVALAELEYTYTGKQADREKVRVVKAESAYAVAKERCDDLAGNAKDVCVKEAKAVEVKALADAKMGEEIGEARRDAAADKSDADYRVAVEKCDAYAGDAKSNCVAAAKTKFGKK
jgi:hypothetical protein